MVVLQATRHLSIASDQVTQAFSPYLVILQANRRLSAKVVKLYCKRPGACLSKQLGYIASDQALVYCKRPDACPLKQLG